MAMDNLELYNQFRDPPDEALKTITGGRLNGMTDINPVWRIKALTKRFGPCGIGWTYEITRQWMEHGPGDEVRAFCNILLYYCLDGVWSKGIPGTGGSSFCTKERSGLFVSDECYKMALTDAISVAAKALGVAASVYWRNDPTKYQRGQEPPQGKPESIFCEECGQRIKGAKNKEGKVFEPEKIAEISKKMYGKSLCLDCQWKVKKAREDAGKEK